MPTFHVIAVVNTSIDASSKEQHYFVTAENSEEALGKAMSWVQTTSDIHVPQIHAIGTKPLTEDVIKGAEQLLAGHFLQPTTDQSACSACGGGPCQVEGQATEASGTAVETAPVEPVAPAADAPAA